MINLVCCIYHAPHPVGESSSESSSSSSDSDSSSDTAGGGASADEGRAPIAGKRKWRKQRGREPGEGCGHDHGDAGGGGRRGENGKAGVKRKSKNAYETVPKVKTEEVKP